MNSTENNMGRKQIKINGELTEVYQTLENDMGITYQIPGGWVYQDGSRWVRNVRRRADEFVTVEVL